VHLQDFALLVQPFEDAHFFIYVGGVDWISTTIMTLLWSESSGAAGLNTLEDGAKGAARVDVGGMFAIKFQAQAASTTTNITIGGNALR